MLPELPVSAGWVATRPGSDVELTSDDGPRLQRAIETQGDGFRVRVRFANASDGPACLHTLSPVTIEGEQENDWFGTGLDGWAVWLEGGDLTREMVTHRFGQGEHTDASAATLVSRTPEETLFRSAGPLLLHHAGRGQNLLVGFVTTDRQYGEVVLATDREERTLLRIDARCHLEGVEVPPGGQVESESVVVLAGAEPLTLLDEYATILGRLMRARTPLLTPSVWHPGGIAPDQASERDILGNLMALQLNGPRVDVVQVDAGYQSRAGDWLLPSERFPRGPGFLAARIRDAGFRPGLWLAPFLLERGSRILAERPDFALRGEDGRVVFAGSPFGPVAVLDCTNADARAWLGQVVRVLVQEWGFGFLTLGLLQFCSVPGARPREAGVTAAGNLRAGLAAIRAAAGGDVFLLARGCPFGPAIGLVDAVAAPHLGDNDTPSLASFWMHRRLWLSSPGDLLLQPGAAPLPEHEQRLAVTRAALAGGPVLLGDDLRALPPEVAQRLERAIPPVGVAAMPLDLFREGGPSVWRLNRPDGAVVALLNDGDAARDVEVALPDLAGLRAVERWSNEPRPLSDGVLRERVPPRDARVLRFYRESPPDDGHLLA